MATTDEHKEFCERVKSRRKELGITQAQMAERMGMTQPQYNGLETGDNEPKFSMQYRIANALEIDIHELLPSSVRSS